MKNQCFHEAINRDLDETGKYWKIAMCVGGYCLDFHAKPDSKL